MKRSQNILTVMLFVFIVSHLFAQANTIGPDVVDFDISMQRDAYAQWLENKPGLVRMFDLFKVLYEGHTKSQPITRRKKLRIPHIIHHIWLGGRLPYEYEPYYQSWLYYHPSWTFIFWTDDPRNYHKGDVVVYSFDELEYLLSKRVPPQFIVVDVNDLLFDNRIYFDDAINYGERGDILDYEIVYRFGGVYVDADFECLKPLDLFHEQYDFYTGVQPLDTNMVHLGAALFGAIPYHPILKRCVEEIKNNQHIEQIVIKTGPLYFTKMFCQVAPRDKLINVAFPASYFYPCGYDQRGTDKALWVKPESYAVHHWAGSWLKPEAFVQKARN